MTRRRDRETELDIKLEMIGQALDRLSDILGDMLTTNEAIETHMFNIDQNTDRLVEFMEAADK